MHTLGVIFCIFIVILGLILQLANAAGDTEPLQAESEKHSQKTKIFLLKTKIKTIIWI